MKAAIFVALGMAAWAWVVGFFAAGFLSYAGIAL